MRQYWLGVLVCGLAAAAAPAQVDSDGLAVQARAVLRAHCRPCHGPGPGAQAGLNVEDRPLLVEKRHLVHPGDAAASRLLDLVAGAAMPPGDRPRVPARDVEVLRQWIDAGAPQPPQPGHDYVLRRIVRDWRQADVPEADRRWVRYLSLNHLLHGDAGRLEAARKELEEVLTAFARGPAKLVAIDPENSVYRVLLSDLGWEKQHFREFDVKNEEKALGPSSLTLYDLLLLEYPYAYLNFSAGDFPALAEMLRQAKSLRPIPYLRGDWLVAALTGTPLGGEIAAGLGRRPPKLAESPLLAARVGLAEAAAELGWKGTLPELQKKLAEARLKGLAAGEALPRAAWEKVFPAVVERLELGKPIVPLDSLSVPEFLGATPLRVSIETSDEKARPRKRFKLKEHLQVRVRPTHRCVLEVFNTAVKGKVYPLLPPTEVAAKRVMKLPPDFDAYEITDDADPGTEKLTVFAADFEDLPGGAASFPPGKLFRAEGLKGVRDRFVHEGLYTLRDDNKGFDSPVAAHLLKFSVGFEVTKK